MRRYQCLPGLYDFVLQIRDQVNDLLTRKMLLHTENKHIWETLLRWRSCQIPTYTCRWSKKSCTTWLFCSISHNEKWHLIPGLPHLAVGLYPLNHWLSWIFSVFYILYFLLLTPLPCTKQGGRIDRTGGKHARQHVALAFRYVPIVVDGDGWSNKAVWFWFFGSLWLIRTVALILCSWPRVFMYVSFINNKGNDYRILPITLFLPWGRVIG